MQWQMEWKTALRKGMRPVLSRRPTADGSVARGFRRMGWLLCTESGHRVVGEGHPWGVVGGSKGGGEWAPRRFTCRRASRSGLPASRGTPASASGARGSQGLCRTECWRRPNNRLRRKQKGVDKIRDLILNRRGFWDEDLPCCKG